MTWSRNACCHVSLPIRAVGDVRGQDRHPPRRAIPAHRQTPRQQKAIVAVSRVICEISCILIADPAACFADLGAGYYSPGIAQRQTRSKIREIERLNPGMKVTLTPVETAA